MQAAQEEAEAEAAGLPGARARSPRRPSRAPPAPPRLKTIQSPIAVYAGRVRPAPGRAARVARRLRPAPRPGRRSSRRWTSRPRSCRFTRPTGAGAARRARADATARARSTRPRDEGAFTYWLDRMVRSRHQLVERLALVFHDWWATRRDGVSTNAEMLNQTNIFRAHGLGSFRDMTRAVTTDPAMLQFLNGMSNRRGAVNENYAPRADGAVHARRRPRRLHRDRRARARQARSPAGARTTTTAGSTGAGTRQGRWDFQHKTVFGKSGRFTWEDACELVLDAPAAPVVLRPQALELLHPDAAERRDVGRARAALRRERACRSGRCWRRSSARPTSTRARGWSSRRSCCSAGLMRATGARDREQRVVEQERPHRPAALLPARRLGLERPALARHEHDRRPLGARRRGARRAGWSRTPAADTYPEQTADGGASPRRAPSGATRP